MRIRTFFSKAFFPRIRGFVYGLISKRISKQTVIYSPILFTYKKIEIGDGVFIYKNCRIQGVTFYEGISFNPTIVLKTGVSIQQNCHITCAEYIEIGENTAIANNVSITDIDHPYSNISLAPDKQPIITKSVIIGADCKIYNNVVILQGVKIGKHCVIGANAIVNKDIPDYSVAVGIPARIIKRYNFDTNQWENTNSDGSFIDK